MADYLPLKSANLSQILMRMGIGTNIDKYLEVEQITKTKDNYTKWEKL